MECPEADRAGSWRQDGLVLAATVCWQSCVAVRANDSQVLQPVVVWNPVYVVEDQGHPTAPPFLTLAAELATPVLETSGEDPSLQLSSVVAAVLDENLFQGSGRTALEGLSDDRRSVEMGCVDTPQQGVLLKRPPVAAGVSVPKTPEDMGPASRLRDRLA
jgi:hypothetical protein